MHSPILGGYSVTRSVNAADNRLVNLYPEAIPEGGKEPGWLSRAPGLAFLASMGPGPVRGLWATSNDAYVVSGIEVYRLTSLWVSTFIGYVSNDGPVSMSDNGTQLFIACNGPSYIYNMVTGVFAQITDVDFPGAVTVGYLEGYFYFNAPESQLIYGTALLDGTAVDPTDFVSATANPDGLVSIMVDHREVWAFGTNTIEVFRFVPSSIDFPLERIEGAYNEVGCAAAYSVAKLDNGLFWLGADARGRGVVYRNMGYSAKRVSTHAVEWHIQSYGNLSDALAYSYQQDGHAFYVLIFPSANTTWVYDVSTDVWHERAGFVNGEFTRHPSNCQMAFGNQVVVGSFDSGEIYAFDMTKYSDYQGIQKWLRTWRALPTGQNNLKRTAHHSLQLDAQTGVRPFQMPAEIDDRWLLTEDSDDLLTEDDEQIEATFDQIDTVRPPKVMLRWSDDAGHTWSNEYWRDMGLIGEYDTRIIWRRLGMTTKLRDRVYEVSGTDPVRVAIMGAELILSPTNS